MSKKLKKFFRYRWVDALVFPPIVVGLCWYVYGETYFASWGNFWMRTLPWLAYAVTVSEFCKWWGATMGRRFRALEEWWKRLIYSVLGYLVFHVAAIFLMLTVLKNLPALGLFPPGGKLAIVVGANFLTMIIFPTLYECTTFFRRWKAAAIEAEQLEKLNLESQYRSLQSQLNPHFLFNSLNVLSSLISENPRRAEDFVDELSNVYRYLLRSNERELATVGEELHFIRSFFHLLETRHDKGISLKIEVPKDVFEKKLPALALQILLENAVKHNEISVGKPLKIEILEAEAPGRLLVRNNLQRKITRVASNHVGLENLRQRYALLGVEGFEVRTGDGFFGVVLPFY